MRQFNTLGISAMVAAALMAYLGAGISSATELYSGGTTMGTGSALGWSLEPGTKWRLAATDQGVLAECMTSSMNSKITNSGSSTTTTTGEITELTWGSCTLPTTIISKGKFEIHHISSTTNGQLTADAEIGFTINTVFFGSCTYRPGSGTSVGIITTGIPSTLHKNAVARLASGGFGCPETAVATASYINTQPGGSGPPRVEAS